MTAPRQIADRAALQRNRERAGRMRASGTGPDPFLHQLAIDEIKERLGLVNRAFTASAVVAGWAGPWRDAFPDALVVPDEPELALKPGAHDLVIHGLCLHWADDPVGQLIQCRRALAPDGHLLAVTFGGTTLHELRTVLAEAEARETGGLAPRVAPMGEIRDLGALLQRAGLALPVADSVSLPIAYKSHRDLARDLRAAGEGNALADRHRAPLSKRVLDAAEALHASAFPADGDRLQVTFDLIFLSGWAPHPDQQQPLRPGSATHSLAEALNRAKSSSED